MSASRSRSLALRGAAVLTALFATLAVLGTWGAAPAEATSYRFWSYWLGGDGDWAFSSQGASRRPADGTVDGWRFAISEASSSTIPPRHLSSFGRICGSTDPVDGSKRVGLVVDFGTPSDAPDGETPGALISTCVVAPTDANGYEVLGLAGVQLRADSGLICGLNGYPATECGVVVADPAPSPTDKASDSNGGNGGSAAESAGGNSGSGSAGGGGNGTDASFDSDSTGSNAGGTQQGGNQKRTGSQQKIDQPGKNGQPDANDPGPEQTAFAISPAAAAAESVNGSGSPVGLAIGLGIVAALLAAAYVLRRRRV